MNRKKSPAELKKAADARIKQYERYVRLFTALGYKSSRSFSAAIGQRHETPANVSKGVQEFKPPFLNSIKKQFPNANTDYIITGLGSPLLSSSVIAEPAIQYARSEPSTEGMGRFVILSMSIEYLDTREQKEIKVVGQMTETAKN